MLISQAPAKTYMPMLGTALLARATSEWVDTLHSKRHPGEMHTRHEDSATKF